MNDSCLCPDGYLLGINVLSITLSLPMVIVFLTLCVLLIIHSKTFHPFFTLSFILLIFSYAICNLCVLLTAILQLYDEESPIIYYIDKAYLWVYMYIQPCVVIGLIERLCATIFVSVYEHSRYWIVYIIGQGLGIGVVYYENVLVENGDYNDTAKNVQFGLSICICVCLVVLFFVNRYLTLHSRHRSKLTVRYQLAENVKALRTFVPFVVVDNCISILFVFSMLFFEVDFSINLEVCRNLPGYTITFAIFRTILLLTQLFMPLLVVKQHSSIWNQVKSQLARRKPTVRQCLDGDPNNKINNVLGMDIAGSNIDYFTQLKSTLFVHSPLLFSTGFRPRFMNRSWEEIFMENCGPGPLQLLSIISVVALVPLSFLFFGAIVAFFRRRKIFHPMFSFCFLVLLSLYYASSTILAIRNIVFAIHGDNFDQPADILVRNCERLYMALNFYIPPLIVISLFERLFATTFSKYYEHSRPWFLVGVGLVCSSILVYIEFKNRHAMMATFSTRNIQTLFAITCSCSLFLLLLANRKKSKTGRAKSALSERYQINENVKALRIQIPVVCIDTAIQIMFLCSDLFWNTAQVLNLNNCYDDNWYLNKFTAFRMIGFALQYFIPFTVLFHFSQFCCNSIRRRPVRKVRAVSPSAEAAPITVLSIRNVLGMSLTGEHVGASGQEAHFKSLYEHWNAYSVEKP